MTSAAKSARVCVQAGPATTRVKSTTSKPSRAVGAPFGRGKRSGRETPATMIRRSLIIEINRGITLGLIPAEPQGLSITSPRAAHTHQVLSAIAQPGSIRNEKKPGGAGHRATRLDKRGLYSEEGFRFGGIADASLFAPPALKRFQPVKRLGPSPGVQRLVKPITGSNKVVRGYDVVRRI